jgi:hypothetical protein
MEFLEKDLEDIIWEADMPELEERGLSIEGKLKRQLRIGNYGIADLVSFERKNEFPNTPYFSITVYELKKDKIGISAFLQAIQYCKGIKTYLEKRKPNISFDLNIVLIGRSIDDTGSFIFLTDLIGSHRECKHGFLNSVNFYTYYYKATGINFEMKYDFDLTNKGF